MNHTNMFRLTTMWVVFAVLGNIALGIPRSSAAAANTYYVSPAGNDTLPGTQFAPFRTIQKAIDLAQPGTTINLAPGIYLQDIVSRRSGTPSTPIIIQGEPTAVVKGAGSARVIEINHDYLVFAGFTVDGLHGNPISADGYRDKLLYAQGKQIRDGVNGLKLLRMTFQNAGGECVRLRYFAQQNEVAFSTILNCGVHDYRFNAGGKNGEGIYIGTAPEQRADGKNPTTDPDHSNTNWIHHNTFDTQGNECVDIKEAATGNIVEHNTCTGQKDPDSGGMDSRGSGNIFRGNTIHGNSGAGVRLGGDTASDGMYNDVYSNQIYNNSAGGVKFQRTPQGIVCGNTMSNNRGGNAVGDYGASFNPAAPCSGATPTPSPAPVSPTPSPSVSPSPTPSTLPTPMPSTAPVPSVPPMCKRTFDIREPTTFIEAEHYIERSGRFAEVGQSSRSGGSYMTIEGTGMQKDPNTYTTFNIDVAQRGTFYVWVLGYGPHDAADSFLIQLDNTTPTTAVVAQGAWQWKKVSASFKLEQRSYVLKIKNRENGASIDKLVLTSDKEYVPSGLGGAATLQTCR